MMGGFPSVWFHEHTSKIIFEQRQIIYGIKFSDNLVLNRQSSMFKNDSFSVQKNILQTFWVYIRTFDLSIKKKPPIHCITVMYTQND